MECRTANVSKIIDLAKTLAEQNNDSDFYLLDFDQILERFSIIQNEFKSQGFQSAVAYSYKTNNLKRVCEELLEFGALAEVVSHAEMEMALEDGYSGKDIVFNGPSKKNDDLSYALKNQVFINIDSLHELSDLIQICHELSVVDPSIGIRLAAPYNTTTSRLGLNKDDAEEALNLLRRGNIPLRGLHFHLGSNLNDIRYHTEFIKQNSGFIHKCIGFNNTHQSFRLDIGGGYPANSIGEKVHKPSISQFAAVICNELKGIGIGKEHINLLVEPGRFLVEDAGYYVCKVVRTKNVDGRNILHLNGRINNVRSIKNWYHPIFSSRQIDHSGPKSYDLYGQNCFEQDIFAKNFKGSANLTIGDLIIIGSAGGYDLPSANVWVAPPPPVFGLYQGTIKLIRWKITAQEMRGEHL